MASRSPRHLSPGCQLQNRKGKEKTRWVWQEDGVGVVKAWAPVGSEEGAGNERGAAGAAS